jgi:hypothetical protein
MSIAATIPARILAILVLLAGIVAAQSTAATRKRTSADPGTASGVTGANLSGERISILAMGAKADDATDSTEAIQKAIYAMGQGGRVYLPADQNRPGSGASGTASVAGGAVTSVGALVGGSGYLRAPYVLFLGGGCQGVNAHTTLQGTSVAAVVIDGGGVNCTSPPTIAFIPTGRCYLVSQIQLLSATMIEGDGAISCIRAKGSGPAPVITNAPIPQPSGFSSVEIQTPASIVLSNFSLVGDGSNTQRGIRLFTNGSGSQNVSNTIIQNVWVHGFTVAGISLSQTYATNLIGIRSNANGYGLLLEGDKTRYTPLLGQAFNGTTTVSGGDYSGNATGIYLDGFTEEFSVRGAVIEGNRGCGVEITPPYFGIAIETNHFESNATSKDCEDIQSGFSGHYDRFGSGLAVRNNVFVGTGARLRGPISVNSSLDPEITGNSNISVPGPGCPGSSPCSTRSVLNTITLGNGTLNPRLNGNVGFNLQNEAGVPLFLYPANVYENAFVYSTDMTNERWGHTSPVVRDNGTCAGCSTGDLFPSGESTWKLPLAALSGPTKLTDFHQDIGAHPGSYISAGFWIRVNAGTGTAFVTVVTAKAGYTGSELNQPVRAYIDTNWRWISVGVALPASDATPAVVGCTIYANTGSSATYANIAYPQAAIDIVNGMPAYVGTDGSPSLRQVRSDGAQAPRGTVTCPAGQHIAGVSISPTGTLTAPCN